VNNPDDTELFKIQPILEMMSHVFDVRLFIKKFVTNNSINYAKANAYLKKELLIAQHLETNQIPE